MKVTALKKSVAPQEKASRVEFYLPPGTRLNDVFMDGQQVMQELYISKRALQNWRTTGKISYTKELGKIFYFRQELALLLMKGKKPRER